MYVINFNKTIIIITIITIIIIVIITIVIIIIIIIIIIIVIIVIITMYNVQHSLLLKKGEHWMSGSNNLFERFSGFKYLFSYFSLLIETSIQVKAKRKKKRKTTKVKE